jgi:outer membrane lipoprotein SlyB
MRNTRLASIAGGVALAALVSACSTDRSVAVNVPPQPAPVYSSTTVTPAAPAPAYATAPAGVEYGRVTNIEYFPGGVSRSGPNVPGAILGGVAGAVLGNQIGSGSGRAAATVLGGAAGAAVGSQVGRATTTTEALYRVTVQTDGGTMRYYDVPATGDLRVGDRVRVDNGMIYRG